MKRVDDIEIGGVAYQLGNKGCLTEHEKDLIYSIAQIRNAIAHGNMCEPRHLIEAIKKSHALEKISKNAGRRYQVYKGLG